MKSILTSLLMAIIWVGTALGSHPKALSAAEAVGQAHGQVESSPETLFKQYIPFVAEQFIGLPVQLGGAPSRTGSTDNSSLFFAIYTAAAQKAGLAYREYLPMCNLLDNTDPVPFDKADVGDLIVLKTGLAAMIYKKTPSGRLYMLYASEKRQEVTSFHSDNLVYQVYWLEHLKDFYRLKPEMLTPAR